MGTKGNEIMHGNVTLNCDCFPSEKFIEKHADPDNKYKIIVEFIFEFKDEQDYKDYLRDHVESTLN